MKDKLKEHVKAEYLNVSINYLTSNDVNKFMDKAAEVDHECVEYIKEVDHDDLIQMIYEGNFDAALEVAESMRKTMIYNAKKVIAEICADIEYDELDEDNASDPDDNGIDNSDRLMECDR